MQPADYPIGVFDSGMGGLTVLKALQHLLPHESFLYLGDTARLPYGTKSIQTVQNYTKKMAEILIQKHIKALVIACNTATTAALPLLQQLFPELPIVGVLDPGAQLAAHTTRNQKIFILATETTILSNGYQARIRQHLPNAHLQAYAANTLVALAEEGLTDNTVAQTALRHYLAPLKDEDTLLLGCTHFPVFMPLLTTLFPQLSLINPAEATALQLKKTLTDLHLLHTQPSPTINYFVTDAVQRFQKIGEIFLETSLDHANIELINA